MRGDGFLYRRTDSPFWWMGFSLDGRKKQVSTGAATAREARRVLRSAIAAARSQPRREVDSDLTVHGLCELRLKDYRRRRLKSASTVATLLIHVERHFGATSPVAELTGPRIGDFLDTLSETKSQSTVRQVSIHLRAALRIAAERGEIGSGDVPPVERIAEPKNARQRSPSREEIEAFCAAAPEWLEEYVWFLFFSGWRSGEAKGLVWGDYNAKQRILTLRDSKNGDARKLPLAGALEAIIEKRRTAVVHEAGYRKLFIFSRGEGQRPIGDVRKRWELVLEESGVDRFVPHDLRRSAARNRRQEGGIDEERVMRLQGWKSRSMLDRYHISDVEDLRRVVASDRRGGDDEDNRNAEGLRKGYVAPMGGAEKTRDRGEKSNDHGSKHEWSRAGSNRRPLDCQSSDDCQDQPTTTQSGDTTDEN